MRLLLGDCVRLDALQVDLLHRLELHVGLGVAAGTPTELAQLVVLIKVELRPLQVLVHILAKHLLEVTLATLTTVFTPSLRCIHLALSQVVHIAIGRVASRPLPLTLAADLRSAVQRITAHQLVALDFGGAGGGTTRRPPLNFVTVCLQFGLVRLVEACNGRGERLELGPTSRDVGRSLDPVHETLSVVLDTSAPELALGLTAIGIRHIDFSVRGHQILKITSLLLLLGLFLGLLLRHFHVDADLSLGLRRFSPIGQA